MDIIDALTSEGKDELNILEEEYDLVKLAIAERTRICSYQNPSKPGEFIKKRKKYYKNIDKMKFNKLQILSNEIPY